MVQNWRKTHIQAVNRSKDCFSQKWKLRRERDVFQITLLYANDDVEKLLSKVKNLFIFCHLAGETGTSLVVALSTLPSQIREKRFALLFSWAIQKPKRQAK